MQCSCRRLGGHFNSTTGYCSHIGKERENRTYVCLIESDLILAFRRVGAASLCASCSFFVLRPSFASSDLAAMLGNGFASAIAAVAIVSSLCSAQSAGSSMTVVESPRIEDIKQPLQRVAFGSCNDQSFLNPCGLTSQRTSRSSGSGWATMYVALLVWECLVRLESLPVICVVWADLR